MLEIFGLYDILLGAIVILLAVYYFLEIGSLPPGPRGVPLLGYLPFMSYHPARKYFELSKKYGPVISVKFGPKTVIILNDYESVRKALVNQGSLFSDRPENKLIRMLSGGYGIAFHVFDDDYEVQKKFSVTALRRFGIWKNNMENKILEEIKYLCDGIRSTDRDPFDCHKILESSVSNVICNVILGSRFSYDDDDFKGMIKVVNQQFSDKVDAFCKMSLLVVPALRFLPLFSKSYKSMFADMDYMVGILQKIVEEHKRTLDPENPRDFVDEYLKEMKHNTNKGSSFCEHQLIQIIRDLFVAGTETTSSTIRWSILLFAHRPDIQTKLHNEIQNVIGDGIPSMQHENDMPYMCAFIHELMRHRTLAPLSMPHMTTMKTSLKGYEIPKDTMIDFLMKKESLKRIGESFRFRSDRVVVLEND